MELDTKSTQEFEQTSREAGRRAFDQIVRGLHFGTLNLMSTLEEQERTWAMLMNCGGVDPEHLQRAARDYDRDFFAAGFFERFQQFWNFATEEYDGVDGSGRNDECLYHPYPQVIPMGIELFQIIECWVTFEFDDDWTFFLSRCGGDPGDHCLAEWRLRQIGKLLGSDSVGTAIKGAHDRQANKTPTLWRIYCNGTNEERALVWRIFGEQAGDELATEVAVKAAIEGAVGAMGDRTPTREGDSDTSRGEAE